MFTEKIFYGICCDRCGEDFESRGDYSYMTEKGEILEEACDQGWQSIDGRHYCPDCYEPNPDPNHDDDHEYRPLPMFPAYIHELKMFLRAIGGWRQEVYENEVVLSYHTHKTKDVEPEHRAMIEKILAMSEHRIEVVDCKGCTNARVLIHIKLKRFYIGDRVRVIHHNVYRDAFGKEGEIVKELPLKGNHDCYAVRIFDDDNSNPHFMEADYMELISRKEE